MVAKLWELIRAREELSCSKAVNKEKRLKYLAQVENLKEAFYKIVNEE